METFLQNSHMDHPNAVASTVVIIISCHPHMPARIPAPPRSRALIHLLPSPCSARSEALLRYSSQAFSVYMETFLQNSHMELVGTASPLFSVFYLLYSWGADSIHTTKGTNQSRIPST